MIEFIGLNVDLRFAIPFFHQCAVVHACASIQWWYTMLLSYYTWFNVGFTIYNVSDILSRWFRTYIRTRLDNIIKMTITFFLKYFIVICINYSYVLNSYCSILIICWISSNNLTMHNIYQYIIEQVSKISKFCLAIWPRSLSNNMTYYYNVLLSVL